MPLTKFKEIEPLPLLMAVKVVDVVAEVVDLDDREVETGGAFE